MSLYNMINGYNPACVLLMPMLGRREHEYPRFRDCFLVDGMIAIYTRVGGGNRNSGFGEEKLYDDPNFVKTYDDEFDSTYGYYLFKVPDKWKADFDLICNGEFNKVSDEYVAYVKEFYPNLAKVGMIDSIFRNTEDGGENE